MAFAVSSNRNFTAAAIPATRKGKSSRSEPPLLPNCYPTLDYERRPAIVCDRFAIGNRCDCNKSAVFIDVL